MLNDLVGSYRQVMINKMSFIDLVAS